MSANYRRILSL